MDIDVVRSAGKALCRRAIQKRVATYERLSELLGDVDYEMVEMQVLYQRKRNISMQMPLTGSDIKLQRAIRQSLKFRTITAMAKRRVRCALRMTRCFANRRDAAALWQPAAERGRSFTHFMQLPPELRLIIWEIAAAPAHCSHSALFTLEDAGLYARVTRPGQEPPFAFLQPSYGLWGACHESRHVMLRLYRKTVTYSMLPFAHPHNIDQVHAVLNCHGGNYHVCNPRLGRDLAEYNDCIWRLRYILCIFSDNLIDQVDAAPALLVGIDCTVSFLQSDNQTSEQPSNNVITTAPTTPMQRLRRLWHALQECRT